MKKILFYLPYSLKEMTSGSTVRPQKMLKAFRVFAKKNNLDLIEIYGESKERQEKLKRLFEDKNSNEILFCYMENSTMPFWVTDKDHFPRTPFLELNLFRFLKRNNIPLGVFYRDAYWMFDNEYPLKGIKKIIMKNLYKIELYLYKKYVNHIFLPSIEMNNYLRFSEKKSLSLPPGGEDLREYHKKDNTEDLNLIYVGGISEGFGLIEMLESVFLLNKQGKKVTLHLVCREDEYKKYSYLVNEYKNCTWLKVYHANGEQLLNIYCKADIAVIPRRKSVYNDFAVPVKLFEYISFGLPVIVTNCKAQANIVNSNKLGIVVKDNVEGLQEGIEFFLKESNRIQFSKFVETSLLNENLWIHRVKQVSNVLLGSFCKNI